MPVVAIYPSMHSSNTPAIIKMTGVLLALQSYYYIQKMFKIVKRKLRQREERKEKNISYALLSENSDQLQLLSYYRIEENSEKEEKIM